MTAKPAENDAVASRYPYYPLTAALRIAEAVKDLGGVRTPVKKSLLAKQLSALENSAAFAQQLASARAYGAIEGRGDSSLTETAKKYFFPTAETDKSKALLEMFATPTAFRDLLKRFDGDKLPAREILGNILHRELGIPESWKDRVSALFSNSAQSIGVIDSQGFIRFDANNAANSNAGLPTSTAPWRETQEDAFGNTTSLAAQPGIVTWKSKSILVQTPEEIDFDTWTKLQSYIQLLKPAE